MRILVIPVAKNTGIEEVTPMLLLATGKRLTINSASMVCAPFVVNVQGADQLPAESVVVVAARLPSTETLTVVVAADEIPEIVNGLVPTTSPSTGLAIYIY